MCSFVRPASDAARLFTASELAVEIAPHGTVAERLRAGGAGTESLYTLPGIRLLRLHARSSTLLTYVQTGGVVHGRQQATGRRADTHADMP